MILYFKLKLFLGDKKKVENVTISKLLPETIGYMTYEGSQTAPGCSEVVTWMILNKPIYITQKQVDQLSCSFHCQFRDSSSSVTFLKRTCVPLDIFWNRPLYLIDMRHDISLTLLFQLYTLRKLNQGDAADPRAPLSGNFRPIQALNGRTIRTNIFLAPAEENEVRHNCHHICFCISFSDFF